MTYYWAAKPRHEKERWGPDSAPVTRRQVLSAFVAALLAGPSLRADDNKAVRARDLPITGESEQGWESLDRFLIDFLLQHNVPGAAVAVIEDQQLVYARGFGRMRRDGESVVLPDSLFRIASLSKPLTALAVARFIERGELNWDDPVCPVLARHPELRADMGQLRDPRWRAITVRHLLQHRGGWDRQQSFDPMFRSVEIALAQGAPPPATALQVIRYMLQVPLDFAPGTRAAYSNFGYCVLGRVLEAVAGEPYERIVQREVLHPAGAARVRLGRTRYPADFEVTYHADGEEWGTSVFAEDLGKPVPAPYGAWYLEAMDAHGGWIASAVDLVRISAAFHRAHNPLLASTIREQMMERPDGPAGWTDASTPKETYYGCGWMVRPTEKGWNCWHTGSLPGTSTLLVRRWDNMHWAVLFNKRRSADGRPLAQLIDPLLHEHIHPTK